MDSISKGKCRLKSVNETHPTIDIATTDEVFVGRTLDTGLCDTLVSKKHLKIRADFQLKCVFLEVIGLNASSLNGITLERNKEYVAKQGDVIEVIPSKYPYKVHFEDSDTHEDDAKTKCNKRKLSGDIVATINATGKRRKWQIDIVRDAKALFPGDTAWESYNKGQLVVFTAPDCKASEKIGAYDLDGTLIRTQSGKVHPINIDDWKIAYSTVISKLKARLDDKYKIVVFTNQAGISNGKTKIGDFKKKIENIVIALSIPMQVFIATSEGYFRKPLPGMWLALSEHKNNGISVDRDSSYYVGDAAGREANKFLKRKKDHSHADRLMALNANLTFYTPEEHFLNATPEKWLQPSFNPKSMCSLDNELLSPPNSKLTSEKLEIIVMVGGPGSGKSSFCKTHLASHKYEVISRDKLGSWQKCVDRVNDCLKAGTNVVVDNTNGNRESRLRYINVAKKYKIPCRCFVMATSFVHCEHNVAFREVIDTNHARINKIVLNSYKKHYEIPTLDEGFSEIVHVNFKPEFHCENERCLYEMYLLSS